ncbi:MAG: histidine kinase [Ferruginibacter sp.]|nr:histidine kinase [Ferruginibacter sp.]
MFNHRYRYLFILILSVYTYLSTELCRVYFYFDISIEWYYAFATITAITAGIWESNHLLDGYFKKRSSRQTNKIRALLAFFLAGCIATTFISVAVVFLVSMVMHNNSFGGTLIPLKLNLIYAWLANLLFHLINAIVFYFTEYKTTLLEAETFKRMSSQAELQVVKNQVNPHFLFNNLNVLSSLIMQNNSEANRFIEEFSKVYRYILKNHEKELVALETELHYLDPYIFLLQKRFTEGLKVHLDIPEDSRQLLIVPAALQLLIENAIKHNIVSRQKPLHISVQINGNNTIVVSNNLQAKQTIEKSTGIGLQNIIKRYSLVSNREVMISNEANIFTVTLPLINGN